MVFSSIRRSITHSARSKLNRNVISGSYNWRNTLRHDSFPPSSTPLGNACVDGCVGILRGYIAYNGAGKQLLSKAYMSNLKSVLGIPRIRRLFSSQGPGKKTLRKLLSEKQEGNSERGRTEIGVQRGIKCRWSGEYSGTVFEAYSRFIAPLMFIGFIVTSLFLNPHQTKEISFQEFKNKLLEPGLVNHVEVANKSVAKVYMRSSACEKVHSDDSVRDTVNGSPSEGNVTQFKYYFNIASVQSFEENLAFNLLKKSWREPKKL